MLVPWSTTSDGLSTVHRRAYSGTMPVQGSGWLHPLTVDLTERRAGDAWEFVAGETVVGRLVWAERSDADRAQVGWWLEAPDGGEEILIFRAAQAGEQARQESESASVFFARTIVADRVAGLLGGQRPGSSRG